MTSAKRLLCIVCSSVRHRPPLSGAVGGGSFLALTLTFYIIFTCLRFPFYRKN